MLSRSVKLAVALMAVLAFLAGCTSSTSSSPSPSGPSGSAAPPSLSTIGTIADLQSKLVAGGIPCTLEYEGLKQDDKTLSICVIDGEQATLSIWDKPELLQKFLQADVGAKGATAVGANWTVDVDTPQTAQKIATALNGTVKSATPPSSAP
ncbi:MAG: hypothetical protein HYX32_08985 [Actinobacteria bacterium]|nr:hypothetical protein [Actinomycetota bacterium]